MVGPTWMESLAWVGDSSPGTSVTAGETTGSGDPGLKGIAGVGEGAITAGVGDSGPAAGGSPGAGVSPEGGDGATVAPCSGGGGASRGGTGVAVGAGPARPSPAATWLLRSSKAATSTSDTLCQRITISAVLAPGSAAKDTGLAPACPWDCAGNRTNSRHARALPIRGQRCLRPSPDDSTFVTSIQPLEHHLRILPQVNRRR